MPVIQLERADDPRVADYRDVPEPELVRSRGLLVAEGRLVVQRLVETREYVVRSLLLSEAAWRALESTLARLEPDVPIYICPIESFRTLTGFNLHRGCLALAERPPRRAPDDLLRSSRTVVALEAVADAGNVGGVFRNAAAFGVDALMLDPSCCDPFYRKAIRTSMGATLRVPFARIEDWPAGLTEFARQGFTVIALSPRDPSETLDALAARERPDRLALLVGAEGAGLSPAAEAAAHRRVRIPISAEVDSLNLSVATGIALSRLTRLSHL